MSANVPGPLRPGFQRSDEVCVDVILPPDCNRTPLTRQSDKGLASEFQAALTEFAGAGVETVFKCEYRIQTATQVFNALETPAASLTHAALHCIRTTAVHVAVVVNTFIDNAVKRDAALRIRCTGERAEQGGTEKDFLHGWIS